MQAGLLQLKGFGVPPPDGLGFEGIKDLQQLLDAKVSIEGARPGTARLRGMIAIHGASQEGEDLVVDAKPNYKFALVLKKGQADEREREILAVLE